MLAVTGAAAFSAHSLQKGQVIKQFEIYSVAESLSHDATGILRTTLPCNGGMRWIHEPPVFTSLGGLFIRLLPAWPALLPLLAYLLLSGALWSYWSLEIRDPKRRLYATILSVWCPVLLRYSIQFVPDVLAAAALVAGVVSLKRERLARGVLFLTAACAVKVLFVAPALCILAWRCLGGRKRMRPIVFALGTVLAVTPYLAWSVLLAATHARGESSLTNAFREDTFLGPLSLLAEPKLYQRWFLWLGVKGAGLVLTGGALAAAVVALRGLKRLPRLHEVDLHVWWFAGSVPYFLLIRQANIVHDYYSIGFALPLILAGTRFWMNRKEKWVPAVRVLSMLLGVYSLASMRPVPLHPGESRPMTCGSELFGTYFDKIRAGQEHN